MAKNVKCMNKMIAGIAGPYSPLTHVDRALNAFGMVRELDTNSFQPPAALITNDSGDTCTVSEGQTTDTPEASDDDDGGDADSDPDGRPPHKPPSTPPAPGSASKQRTRAPRLTAGQNPAFQVIGITEFDLAESIGMSVEFLRKDRSGKRLIPFYRIGAAIRYNPARVTESLARLEVGGYTPKPKANKARQSTLTAR